MSWRECSPGMRLTAATAWFTFRPDRWQQLNEDRPPSSASRSSSDSSEDPATDSTRSTDLGNEQRAVRVLQVEPLPVAKVPRYEAAEVSCAKVQDDKAAAMSCAQARGFEAADVGCAPVFQRTRIS